MINVDFCCHDCAIKAGGRMPTGHIATYHDGVCDVCGVLKTVTEPRDYRYPRFDNILGVDNK
jgi:hypothetical protein